MAVDAGTIYSDVRIQIDKLKGDINRIITEYDKLGENITQETKDTETKAKKSFNEINFAALAAFTGISIAIKKSITSFASFEQSLANVQSVARATPKEFEALESAAAKAGETTRFTASQAADALYALASAGLDATESVAALDGVLDLAAATQSDLEFTSQTVTAAISQFGLEAKESSRVANTFSAAIANSQANMEKLSSAFRQVGPVAGTLGISLEETTGALQALFNAGFRGEQAGTVLRNVLSQLADTTGPVSTKLADLGVNLEKVNPATNSLIDVLGTLAEANLSTGETINAFGTEAGPGLLTLLAEGRDGLQKYTDAVTGTNSAAEAAAIQMDTVQGSIDQLKSVAEAVSISFVKEFEPALRGVVDVIAEFLRIVNGLPGPIKLFIGALAIGIPVVVAATSAVSAFGAAFSVLLGPVGLVLTGVAGLTAGVVGLTSAIDKSKTERLTKEFGSLAEQLNITEKEIDMVSKALLHGAWDTSFGNAEDQVYELAKATGLTREQIVAIGLANKEITGEYRTQLEQMAQAEELAKSLKSSEEDLLDLKKEQRRIQKEQIDEARKEKEAAELEAESALIAEIERVSQVTANRLAAEKIRQKEIAVTERLLNADAIDEEESVKRIIAAYTREIETLAEIGFTGELVKKTWVGANGEIVEGIQAGDRTMRTAIDTVAKLIERQKELGAVVSEAGISEEEREKKLISLRQEYLDKIDELVLAEEELNEKKRNRMLATADGDQVAIDAINEYFDLLRDTIRAEAEAAKAEVDRKNRLIDLESDYANSLNETVEVKDEAAEAEEERQKRLIALKNKGFKADSESQNKMIELTEEYRDKIDNLILSEEELNEKKRERALIEAVGNQAAIDAINEYFDLIRDTKKAEDEKAKAEVEINNNLIALENEYTSSLEEEEKQKELISLRNKDNVDDQKKLIDLRQEYLDDTKNALDLLADYQNKLFEINATEEASLDIQEGAAIAAIERLEAEGYVITALKDKVREYFAAVRKSREETILFGNVTQKEFDDIVDATDKITNSMLNVLSAIQSGDNIIGSLGASFNLLGDIAEETGTELGMAFSNVLGPVGVALNIIQKIYNLFTNIENSAIEYQNKLTDLSDQIAQQTLENRKKTLEQEYEAEVNNIKKIKDAKIKGLSAYFSDELKAVLIQQGILEGESENNYDAIYNTILKKSRESGVRITDEEKERIKEILEAQKKADQEAEQNERNYKNALAQWDYDKAVADKQIALTNAMINKERALSELSWWDVNILNRDDDIRDMFDRLIGSIGSIPLPAVPKFQTGGVVPGTSYNGDRVIIRGNSGEGIFTKEQMNALGLMINGGGKVGSRVMNIVFELNGKQIAENTVSFIDDGKVRFKVLAR